MKVTVAVDPPTACAITDETATEREAGAVYTVTAAVVTLLASSVPVEMANKAAATLKAVNDAGMTTNVQETTSVVDVAAVMVVIITVFVEPAKTVWEAKVKPAVEVVHNVTGGANIEGYVKLM